MWLAKLRSLVQKNWLPSSCRSIFVFLLVFIFLIQLQWAWASAFVSTLQLFCWLFSTHFEMEKHIQNLSLPCSVETEVTVIHLWDSQFQTTLAFASSKLVRACWSLIVKCIRRGGGFGEGGVLFWRQTADSNIFLRHISSIRHSQTKQSQQICICPNMKDKFARRQKQPKQICNLLKDQLNICGKCAFYVRHNLPKAITPCLRSKQNKINCFTIVLISVINLGKYSKKTRTEF